jgi:hypothetical protein
MRLLLPMLAGCTYPPAGTPTGTLAVEIGHVPAEDLALDRLEVSIGELVFDAVGPSGRESVEVLVDRVFEPLDAVDAVGIDLELGDHTGCSFTLSVRADDGPGLRLAGVWQGQDEDGDQDGDQDEDEQLSIEVDELVLPFDLGSITATREPLLGRIDLDPDAWLDGLEREEEGELAISPGSPGYDRLVEAIVTSTRFSLDPAKSDGDDDDDDNNDNDEDED